MRNAPVNILAIVLLVMLGLSVVGCGGCLLLIGAIENAKSHTASAETQAVRSSMIDANIDSGLLDLLYNAKLPGGARAVVHVKAWNEYPPALRESMAEVWAAWAYHAPDGEFLTGDQRLPILDATGREIAVVTKDGLQTH